jgi:hypothetical protein
VVLEQLQEKKPSPGRKLFEVPDSISRVFVIYLPDPPEEIWCELAP